MGRWWCRSSNSTTPHQRRGLKAPAYITFALVLGIVGAREAAPASRYDPALRFQTFATPHFIIYFHRGEERLAARLAAVAEDVHGGLLKWLPPRHRGRTHVVLVDQGDLPNGSATPIPYNTIEIHAVPPIAEDLIGNLDDWLRMVFAHEYVHVLHLDRSVGWALLARRLFGRTPYAFPNLFLPAWQVEGLATYQESAMTGRGRLAAGDFFQLPAAAARAGSPEPLDRVNGGLIDWPAGTAPYAYGAFFHEYLAKRFGEARLAQLANRTAGRVPYFASPAFRSVFGVSLKGLWQEFERDLKMRATAQANATDAGVRRVTTQGFVAAGPRWDPGAPDRLLYSARTPHDFPSLMMVSAAGGAPRRVLERYLGERVTIRRGALLFEQLELVRNIGLVGDLYAARRRDAVKGFDEGAIRLTKRQRIGEPDLSPDERTVVCTVAQPGARALALLRPSLEARATASSQPEILFNEPDTTYSAPRWSPDGALIAVVRRQPAGHSELVTVDPATRAVRVLLASARLASPAWMPDGETVLVAAQHGIEPFQLYGIDLASARVWQLPSVSGGARSPDVSPDGRTVAFIGYTTDGYDVFTMPIDRAKWTPVADDHFGPAKAGPYVASVGAALAPPVAARPYTPWSTLRPTSWFPEVTYDNDLLKIGGSTYGIDVLGRHYYFARVLANVEGGAPDWSAAYVYDRWRPQWFVSASGERSELREGRLDEYTADLGVSVPFRRVRQSITWFGGLHATRERLICDGGNRRPCGGGPDATLDRHALRSAVTFTNARAYGYSISRTDGASMTLTSEHVREALGASGDADALTLDGRVYVRGAARHHVLAVRAGAGLAGGDRAVRRVFNLGGSGPQTAFIEFGSDAIALLRGFEPRDASGRRAAVLNVDYRFPLARVERGYGVWPLFLRSVHGAFFADAGHAWDGPFRLAEARRAVGAELSLDVVAGFFAPVTMTGGVAWRKDGTGAVASGAVFYARVGRAF